MTPSADESFPVVGLGASAGGLEAISDLIAELPARTGMAFLLVQHLDPQQPTFLTQLLARKTSLAVETAVDGKRVEPDRLYVIPPNTSLTVTDGHLRLQPRDSNQRPHKPVNLLFQSLAEHYADRAVAVVLSGTDADGAQGLEEVKAAGGITMAQTPASAKYEGMPDSAIATGCVDFILPPKELGQKILEIGRDPSLFTAPPDGLGEDQLKQVFRLLRVRHQTDFSGYKRSTVQRRIAQRMARRRVGDLAEYIELLRQEPAEISALAQDFLIPVTGFFRDPKSFAGLAQVILPALLENRTAPEPLRIWVPGCASGEEVYSIAMVLLECLGGQAPATQVQIFGTDLSESTIEKARTGFYPETIANEVSPERLRRFFIKQDAHYQIAKSIRDWCIFAPHDLTRDPPFSRLDLVSCRNLLIYLDPNLQRRIISFLHYGLNANGFLILGASETIGRSSELFRAVEGYPQIYRKQPMRARPIAEFPAAETAARREMALSTPVPTPSSESELAQRETERLLLTRYAPASVLIDDDFNIAYFNGETSRYLEHARGAASLNLQKLCRPSLLVELSTAIQKAQQSGQPVFRENIRFAAAPGGEEQEVSLEIIPVKLADIESRYWLILFRPSSAPAFVQRRAGVMVRVWNSLFGAGTIAETEKDRQIASLRQELNATHDYLQATIEKYEAAIEEMKSAHEEALSANEEFLSTNEELETAKEELQSANEEMNVTNQELRNRNHELTALNEQVDASRDLLDAMVETVRGSLLVLDADLRVQKVNQEFYRSFQVQSEATLQRRFYELGNGQWNIPALRTLLEEILPDNHTLQNFVVTHEFPRVGEKTMLLNARRLEGSLPQQDMILLAIEDITARTLAQKQLEEAEQRKNNFLSMLAHELRNPLAPIRIAVELLRRTAQATDVPRLNIIERQIQRLVRLVDDLLDIARIERDHVQLYSEAVDIRSVVNQAVEASRHLLDEQRHHLSLVLPVQPIRVFADPLRLEQVVTNLINNAAKYTDTGGEIAVRVQQRDDEAIIEVRDNGIGIAPELLPQLFEMFFQADTALDRSGGGLGIGLHVAKRLVEMQEGSIEGTSAGLGQGSKFTIRLPLLRDADIHTESEPQETLGSAAAIATPARRVLLVDDNRDMAESIAQLARLWGHEVAVAFDGPAALELVNRFQPDIAIIDIGLPQMNGYELAERLRELPGMAKVPLVALTGYGREEDRQSALEAGFTLHLVKPVLPARLEQLFATLTV